jgi:hypothetical protein
VQTNGGIKLADNQRRGLAGTGGRFLETPNAFDPARGQRRSADVRVEGAGRCSGVHRAADRVGAEQALSATSCFSAVYGDAIIERGGWIDRIASTQRSKRCWSTTRLRPSVGS